MNTTKKMTDRWVKKCEGISQMQRNMNKLLKQVSDDLLSKDEKTALTALVVRIIMRTSERVGNDESAKNGHFGVTGLQAKHIKEVDRKGDITLSYIAKSGVVQNKYVDIGTLATRLLIPLTKRPGNQQLFQTLDGTRITNRTVNTYLSQFGVTAKDIRCYNCNKLMLQSLRLGGKNLNTATERKRFFMEKLRNVAAFIGHGAPTLRKHYLIQSIETQFINEGKLNTNLKC